MTPGNSGHVLEACDACFAMLIQAVAKRASVSAEEAERRALGIWCSLHGLAQLGGEAGVLRQRVTLEEEGTLATRFTHLLASKAQVCPQGLNAASSPADPRACSLVFGSTF